MLSGPKVDIYVSKKRKQFSIQKDFLVHYSGYFQRRLDPKVKLEEADQDVIYLLDDDADDFALIVDYIYRRAVITTLPEETDLLKVAHCLRFIKLTGKLEIGEAASVVYPALKKILAKNATYCGPTTLIPPEFIRIAFNSIPAKNNILELLTRAAMPETLTHGGGKYQKVLGECEAFAAESWRQFQAVRDELRLSFPMSPYGKKFL
jgi:hypothetical protein